MATVFYKLKDRKPEQIHRFNTNRFYVTADGSLDQERSNEAFLLSLNRAGWGSPSGARTRTQGSVIDATARFNERRWARYHPQLSGPALGRILQALFGRANN